MADHLAALQAGDLAAFEALLTGLMSENNEHRVAAEALLTEFRKTPDAFVCTLVRSLRQSQDPTARTLSAVLLRKVRAWRRRRAPADAPPSPPLPRLPCGVALSARRLAAPIAQLAPHSAARLSAGPAVDRAFAGALSIAGGVSGGGGGGGGASLSASFPLRRVFDFAAAIPARSGHHSRSLWWSRWIWGQSACVEGPGWAALARSAER